MQSSESSQESPCSAPTLTPPPSSPSAALPVASRLRSGGGGDGAVPTSACHGRRTCEESIPLRSVEAARFRGSAASPPCVQPADLATPSQSMVYTHGPGVSFDMVPTEGMVFKSFDCAYDFYEKYAYHAGFDVRKSRTKRTLREICCTREGRHKYKGDEANRERRRTSKRTGCKAYVKVKNVMNDGIVSSVVFDVVVIGHNHPLTPSPSAVKQMRSHKNRGDTLMEFVDTVQECRVTQNMHGGQENVPFTSPDLENRNAANVRAEMAGDINNLLAFFNECKMQNSKFYWDMQLDEDGVVKNIFWSHASSQAEYADFGDAVTFDTTYKTNKYEMSLAMFVGANHHMQDTLFGCALLRDKKIESFEWLFRTFKNCMGDCPSPRCILTDQDDAMAVAITHVFPETIHRLCRWLILENHSDALNILYARDSRIEPEMMLCVNQTYTPQEFENAWSRFIDEFDLHDSVTQNLYEIRHRWIPAFFKEDYCGRMTSTQQSESVNKLVKRNFVDHQTNLHGFARRMLDAIISREEKEAAETRACLGTLITKTRWSFAVQMSRVYTRAVFKLFEEALDDCTAFRIDMDIGDTNRWIVSDMEHSEKHDWCQLQFKVLADVHNGRYECECKQWEHTGLLCTHLLRTFIHAQVEKIPPQYVLRRYTMKAKSDMSFDTRDRVTAGPDGVQESYRRKTLLVEAMAVVRSASKSRVAYERAMAVLKELRRQIDEILPDSVACRDDPVACNNGAGTSTEVISQEPPPKPKTKERTIGPEENVSLGTRGKKLCNRVCSWCGLRDGHYTTTCPKNPANFEKVRKAMGRGRGRRGRSRGSGRGGGRGTTSVSRSLIDVREREDITEQDSNDVMVESDSE